MCISGVLFLRCPCARTASADIRKGRVVIVVFDHATLVCCYRIEQPLLINSERGGESTR